MICAPNVDRDINHDKNPYCSKIPIEKVFLKALLGIVGKGFYNVCKYYTRVGIRNYRGLTEKCILATVRYHEFCKGTEYVSLPRQKTRAHLPHQQE